MGRKTAHRTRRFQLEPLEDRVLLSTVGVDVKGNSPYAGDATWVDLRHLLLPWGQFSGTTYSPNPSLKLNSTGYPESTAGTYAEINNYPDGNYQVSYSGQATLDFFGIGQLAGPATLGSDGLYHAMLHVNHAIYPDHITLMLQVTGLDPSNPFGNLKIIMPGYSPDTTQLYTNNLLQDLQPFSYIRMVEWNGTINSTQVNWSDRVLPQNFLATGPNGVSYEEIIAMANEASRDLWINVPAMATDSYVQSLAQLIQQDLNPNLKVYVEYSNETWNASFSEYFQVLAAAQNNPLVTDKSNQGVAVAQQSAYMTKHIGDIFKQVFGSQASRVLPVLGSWAAVPSYNQNELAFLQSNYGSVSNSISAFAIAPYVTLASGTDRKGMSMTALFNSMEKMLNTDISSWLTQNEALSQTYGVPVISYEAGQGLYPYNSKNPQLEIQAQSNPGMYTLYSNLIAMWEKDMGTPLTFYALNDSFWGLLPSVSATGAPKWDAVMNAILPAGDADLDGKVTAADINIIEAHMGQTNATWGDGDFNHDGVVDAQDLALAEANLPATPAAATFVAQDSTTQGSWKGVYGSDGYTLVGDQSSLPVYAQLTTQGTLKNVWSNSTSDVRALQKGSSTATDRIAAAWYSNSNSFTININLPDSLTHVVSIYALDWDNQGRSEQIQVTDASTGAVLDTRTISSFAGGVYLSWQLTGNVEFTFTGISGPNPVVSGIFFDHTGSSMFAGTNKTAQGNWQGTFGSEGYLMPNIGSSIPSYLQVTPSNQINYTWSTNTTDVRALKRPAPQSGRVASSWYSPFDQFSVNVNFSDSRSHLVTFYLLDWGRANRIERVDLIDPSTGAVLDSRTITNLSGGIYLSWKMSGDLTFRFTRLSGPNPVINGIFFDPVLSSSISPAVSSSSPTPPPGAAVAAVSPIVALNPSGTLFTPGATVSAPSAASVSRRAAWFSSTRRLFGNLRAGDRQGLRGGLAAGAPRTRAVP